VYISKVFFGGGGGGEGGVKCFYFDVLGIKRMVNFQMYLYGFTRQQKVSEMQMDRHWQMPIYLAYFTEYVS